ncbi:FxLYD domain-containing protein [Halobacteria archaeon AArc-m2/3/4]|uniref:FxLYD domain-containing protein n=1 Tax=Natronoglomus mannanivorans TaxID=2979990 RepID=A0ABT2QC71_9EURY|nr:FxLYD domain-containing protein [Halobacteria archaeon AArc-m2/3/4]
MTRVDDTRRRLLASLGAGAAIAVAGCTGASGEPHYEDGDVDVDGEGEERSAEEMTAAQSLAEQEIHESVTPLDTITIDDHEFVLEDGFVGSTVQGSVENTDDERVELVEVRVRVYDDEGDQLGRYIDRTGDLDGESTWEFTVVLLESPSDIDEYDIAALGTPS